MRLLYLFRKSDTFSIEKVFQLIIAELKEEHSIDCVKAYSKYEKLQSVLVNYFFLLLKLPKVLHSDIVHVTGVIHYIVFILPRNKTILTIHDCIKYYQHKGVKQLIVKYLWFKFPVFYLKHITVISEKTKQDLVSITSCDPDKITVIKNPLTPKIKTQNKIFNSSNPKILHIGTTPNKNLTRLIESLENITCTLVVIGHLKSDEIKLLTTKKIQYLNYVNLNDEEIINQYYDCDIVSFITTFEGFGLPIIEGQMSGRVVITSNLNPHKEVGSDGAYYVNPYSNESIRNGVINIIENQQLRNTLLVNGLKNAQQYNSKVISKHYEAFYKNIINSNK